MQHHPTRFVTLAATLLLAAACSGTMSTASTSTVATTAGVTTPPSDTAAPSGTDGTSVPVTDAIPDPLEPLLFTKVPAGYTQVPDADANTGPSDLAKAVADDGSADAEAVLTAGGYVHGYQRSWQTSDGNDMIIVFLYQFSKTEGATAYQQRLISGFDADKTVTSKEFGVQGIPGATARALTNLAAAGGLAAAIAFTKGGYLVQIDVIGETDASNEALAQQLAADQYSRL